MKKTLATTAFLAVSAASAFAADLSPMYSKAPLATQAFSWTGVYVGINAGALLHAPTIDDKACDLSCSSQTLSSASATVGGTLGYNHQFGAGVVGLEGDINWANAKQDLIDPAWGMVDGSAHHTRMDWFSTIRLRAGLAVDRALIYATGGVAFVDRNVNGQYSTTGACNTACFSIKDTAVGFVGGVGAEYAFAGPWSAKMEYLYIATPTKQQHNLWPGSSPSDIFGVTTSTQVLRVGLNYRFF